GPAPVLPAVPTSYHLRASGTTSPGRKADPRIDKARTGRPAQSEWKGRLRFAKDLKDQSGIARSSRSAWKRFLAAQEFTRAERGTQRKRRSAMPRPQIAASDCIVQ